MHETLKKLTAHVRETKGSGEALRFYVNFIQPIKEYFGGEEEVKKLNLQNVSNNEVKLKFNEFANKQQNLDSEFVKIVNDNFWDLL